MTLDRLKDLINTKIDCCVKYPEKWTIKNIELQGDTIRIDVVNGKMEAILVLT